MPSRPSAVRFPIRYKILAVLGLLLTAAVAFYTLLASSIFREEKTALLYDINHSLAVNTAAQLRAQVLQLAQQLRLFALSESLPKGSGLRLSSDFLERADLEAAYLLERGGTGFRLKSARPETPATPFPPPAWDGRLVEATSRDIAFWAESRPGEEASFFLAVKLSTEGRPNGHVVIGRLKARPLFETLQAATLFPTYLLRSTGDVLLHWDQDRWLASLSLGDHPLVLALRDNASGSSGVSSYEHAGQRWYGAFAPVGIGDLYIVSQADRQEVTRATDVLVQRSLLFALIVVTATFLGSILFSGGLTRNLQHLTGHAIRIGSGDLSAKIEIRSRDEVGNLASSFNAMIDALRQSREAIERYNRELEAKVDERTRELQEKNLAIEEIQTKLLKTTQLAAAGEVAGRTAHEVLNPLTAIAARLERLKVSLRRPQAAEAPSQLLEILQAWESEYRKGGPQALLQSLSAPSEAMPGKTLLEEDLENLKALASTWRSQAEQFGGDIGFLEAQALRISRIVEGMRSLVRSSAIRSDVSCHQAVQEATLTVSDMLAKYRIALDLKLNAPEDTAVLNRDELVQILTNVIRNAFQAIRGRREWDEGGGRIVIETSNDSGLLYIDVTDNGVGIPESVRAHLFEQGFTTKSPTEGTGLGLSICRRYARAFGGEVELRFSEPGSRGTSFRVTVPLKAQSMRVAV